ncbi:MAG: cation transporter [Polyangiaceae bacterium]|nr:cation transporter [Polyangiaceae bacterium]
MVEFSARSTALLGDSLDMFADAAVYGLSLYVINLGPSWTARASLAKGVLMALLGGGVLTTAIYNAVTQVVPDAPTMGAIGLVALAANVACLALLFRRRQDDINMRSSWICSRNDIIANISVIAAAAVVGISGSRWPDIFVGVAIATLFLSSARGVLRDGLLALKHAN